VEAPLLLNLDMTNKVEIAKYVFILIYGHVYFVEMPNLGYFIYHAKVLKIIKMIPKLSKHINKKQISSPNHPKHIPKT